MTDSRQTVWATIWGFLRRDLPFERFYERACEDDGFEEALGSDLFVDVLVLNSRDDPRLPGVVEALWARARHMLSVLECRCIALSSSTWIPGDEAQDWIRPLSLIRERKGGEVWETGRRPVSAYRCERCGQGWLVLVDGEACFSRLNKKEVSAIINLDSWPERFDEISRALLHRDRLAVACILRDRPSVLHEEGTFACRDWGISPFHTAVETGDIGLVRQLLDAGVNLHALTNDYGSALNLAVGQGHLEVARELLECGIGTEGTDYDGFTPLHLAAHGGDMDMVTLLLTHGANRRAATDWGSLPHELASRNGHSKVAALLEESHPGERN